MLTSVYEWWFLYCIIPPEYEYYSFPFFRKIWDNWICKLFPSLFLMWSWLSWANCQNRIKKQYSLWCPISEISIGSFISYIWFQFFENITETGLDFWSIGYWEWESHGSTRSMIGILTENNYLHIIKMSNIQCLKYVFLFRKT